MTPSGRGNTDSFKASHTLKKHSLHTYKMNNDFQRSSSLLNAYKALHVAPRSNNAFASRNSNIDTRSSSGKQEKEPAAILEFSVEVYALPAGRTPRGWTGTVTTGLSVIGRLATAPVASSGSCCSNFRTCIVLGSSHSMPKS